MRAGSTRGAHLRVRRQPLCGEDVLDELVGVCAEHGTEQAAYAGLSSGVAQALSGRLGEGPVYTREPAEVGGGLRSQSARTGQRLIGFPYLLARAG